MLIAGAKRLAELSPAISSTDDGEYNGGALLPDFGDSPRVNFEVGVTVAEQAVKEGTATADWSGTTDEERQRGIQEVRNRAEKKVWVPIYPEYIYDQNGQNDA